MCVQTITMSIDLKGNIACKFLVCFPANMLVVCLTNERRKCVMLIIDVADGLLTVVRPNLGCSNEPALEDSFVVDSNNTVV